MREEELRRMAINAIWDRYPSCGWYFLGTGDWVLLADYYRDHGKMSTATKRRKHKACIVYQGPEPSYSEAWLSLISKLRIRKVSWSQ